MTIEHQESNDFDRVESRNNFKICSRIMTVLLTNDDIKGERVKSLMCINPDHPTQHVEISAPPRIFQDESVRAILPEKFKGETVEFNDSDYLGDFKVSTPYGEMNGSDTYYKAPNGKFFYFCDYLLFTIDGDAAKFEDVSEWVPRISYIDGQEYSEEMMLTESSIIEIDFNPDPSDSRFVKLSARDYEKVGVLLPAIEDGRLTIMPNPNEYAENIS